VVKHNGLPLRAVILSKFTVVSSFKEWSDVGGWCMIIIFVRNGLDSHSPGQTHSLQVAL
jgi:hypothetical protein